MNWLKDKLFAGLFVVWYLGVEWLLNPMNIIREMIDLEDRITYQEYSVERHTQRLNDARRALSQMRNRLMFSVPVWKYLRILEVIENHPFGDPVEDHWHG